MVLKIANRSDISPFIVMDVMRAANVIEAKGKDVLHLEVGQPSSAAPIAVRETAKRALDKEVLGYTDSLGMSTLRVRLSDYYADYYSCYISEEKIVITTGSSAGFILAFLCAFDIGDRVGVVSPVIPHTKIF